MYNTMGCFSINKTKAAYIAEPNYGKKAQLMLMNAQKKERKVGCCFGRVKFWKKAVKSYDTYLRCMAVHLFKETNHMDLQQMVAVCSNGRAITGYKRNLVMRIIQKKRTYKPKHVMCPGLITPAQWAMWIRMCNSSDPIEYHLQYMGLVPYMTALAQNIAVSAASKSAVSITNTNTNTNTGPSVNVTGPTTTINPTISTNPVMNSNPVITTTPTLSNGTSRSLPPLHPGSGWSSD